MHQFLRFGQGFSRVVAALVVASTPAFVNAQQIVGTILPGVKAGGSANLKVLAHLPLGGFFRAGDVSLEQEAGRPYAYVAQSLERTGFSIVDFRDPEKARIIYRWTIPDVAKHHGLGGVRPRYFKSNGRYYLVQGFRFAAGSPDDDLVAIVFDVTGLPDTSKVREVGRIRASDARGGVHDIFAYKHTDGRSLLFAAVNAPKAFVYDLEAVVANRGTTSPIATIPIPDSPAGGDVIGYAGISVAYEDASKRDLFYGAGRGGYYVYDVSYPSQAKIVTSVVGAAGVTSGSTIATSPDGRYAITGTGYQYSPIRLFDLAPGLEGKVPTISRTAGAWTADWHDAANRAEVRWPFVFVSAYEDGLQIFNMVNPENPQTVGWYFTCMCAHEMGADPVTFAPSNTVFNGAVGVDVRNSDGLVAVSDANSGFWLFRMDGFSGWKGTEWGVPDVSNAQDWDKVPRKRFVP